MRGLMSVLIVFALAASVIILASAYSSSRERALETSTYALELERGYYSKLGFKHSVMQALARGAEEGSSREERAEGAAKKLSDLADYLEKRGAIVWCGIITDGEASELPEEIAETEKPLVCKRCWKAQESAVFLEAFPEKKTRISKKCLSFIDVDTVSGKAGVSKGGLSITKDAEVASEQFSGRFVLGVSFFDETSGHGLVALVPEGTWVGYDG